MLKPAIFSRSFGRKDAYTEKVQKASLEKIAQLIKVCNFLLQTKVYLFWEMQKGFN
jgi:hypothetical protein